MPSRTDHRDSMSLAGHFTGIDIDFVPGITDVEEKALPPVPPEKEFKPGEIRSWRAHMIIIRTKVEQNISSALIMEDDIDWDLRIKSQLQNFARTSRLLLQPIRGTLNDHYDITNPRRSFGDEPQGLTAGGSVVLPTSSPCGDLDRWDVLWLGRCGVHFAQPGDERIPLGRVLLQKDETMPESRYIKHEWGTREAFDNYPEHTRIVHTPVMTTCTLAYALSLPAARRLLYEFGIKTFDHSFDMLLRHVCQGSHGRSLRTCLTVQSQLFQHHRPSGLSSHNSDIGEQGQEADRAVNPVAYTPNIKLSTKVNFPKLIEGQTDYIDQLPDGGELPYCNNW